ncbi:MAG: IS66 family insertion sequence element accessory protein TnpB [Mariniphaga sp.]
MFSFTFSLSYFLYNGATDMRKSFNGLGSIVTYKLSSNPLSGEVVIFINKWYDPRGKPRPQFPQ